MSKRRGFTLTEIVVVIALTSLVLAMVGGCLYFVSTYSGTLISKSEELTKVQTIETYLRGFATNEEGNLLNDLQVDDDHRTIGKNNKNIVLKNDTIKFGDQDVIKNTNLTTIEFEIVKIDEEDDKGFLRCKLVFQSGNDYTFILGIVDNTTSP